MHRDSLPARRRYTRLAGSADALALARLTATERPLAVISATALDAQRLLEEIQWFAPQLRALCEHDAPGVLFEGTKTAVSGVS